jgi:hypothetical protein
MASMRWVVTKDDVAKNRLVEPGWHPLEIVDFQIALSKKKDSNNAIYDFKVLSPQFSGAIVRVWFNEKAAGAMTPLLIALGNKQSEDGSINVELSKEALMGLKVKGFIVRGEFEGKPKNEINDYAALV